LNATSHRWFAGRPAKSAAGKRNWILLGVVAGWTELSPSTSFCADGETTLIGSPDASVHAETTIAKLINLAAAHTSRKLFM
jgi:hypothetical protein